MKLHEPIEIYRGYAIHDFCPPVPLKINYSFVHPDYDGAPDAYDKRCGTAESIEDAKRQIDEYIEEN